MTLDELISPIHGRLGVLERNGDQRVTIDRLTDDSRKVGPGSLFVAVQGERVDGHQFLDPVVAAGAAAVVVQRSGDVGAIPCIRVQDSRAALGILGSRFYGDPSAALRMIGVTGTNGKTTTTYRRQNHAGSGSTRQVGLIGTVAYLVGNESIPASHTTPGALELQKLFAANGRGEVGYGGDGSLVSCVGPGPDRRLRVRRRRLYESHAGPPRLSSRYGALFPGEAETLVYEDWARGRSRKRAIINVDDPWGARIRAACTVPVWTYGLHQQADIRAEDVQLSPAGTSFTLRSPFGTCAIQSRLVGEHNVYNLLAAIGVVLHEGLTLDQVRSRVETVTNVPGRFELVEAGQDFHRGGGLCAYRRRVGSVVDRGPGASTRPHHHCLRVWRGS